MSEEIGLNCQNYHLYVPFVHDLHTVKSYKNDQYFPLLICPILLTLHQMSYIHVHIYIRLKIKPNSVRIRFQSCQMFVLPSTGYELTPLIHCSTIRLALRPAPQTTSYIIYIEPQIYVKEGGDGVSSETIHGK